MLIIQILLCLTCVSVFTTDLNTKELKIEELESVILKNDNRLTGEFLRENLNKKFSLKDLKRAAINTKSKSVLNAVQATKNFYSKKNHLPIKPNQFLEIAYFIQTELKTLTEKENISLNQV